MNIEKGVKTTIKNELQVHLSPYRSVLVLSIIFIVLAALTLSIILPSSIYLISIATILTGLTISIIYMRLTRHLKKDISQLSYKLVPIQLNKIEECTDYSAGSGALYIPILGDLFPRIWGQKMSTYKQVYAFDVNDIKHRVLSNDITVKAKNNAYLVIGSNSNIELGCIIY